MHKSRQEYKTSVLSNKYTDLLSNFEKAFPDSSMLVYRENSNQESKSISGQFLTG